jgi:large subunit ribosomal protein L9
LPGSIKNTWSHQIKVRLHPEVTASFDLAVLPGK